MTGEVVGVRHSEAKGAGFSGLQTCGSVWICPVCSAKIMARRSIETGVMLLAWENLGGRLAFGTLTMRHHRGQSLSSLWDGLADAWDSVIRSRVWAKWRKRLDSPGLIKVIEVNYGPNGWHVHLHFALLLGPDASLNDLSDLEGWLIPKWQRALAAHGFDSLPVAQDLRMVSGVDAAAQLGEYLAKATAYAPSESLGRELFGSASKSARGNYSTVSVWRVLEHVYATGELDHWNLWLEYEKGSKGRRQYAVSKGLRDLLGVVEVSDEEIAAEEAGDRDLVQITREGWQEVLRSGMNPAEILSAMESGGAGGVCRFLDSRGIEHREVASNGQEAV